jgi:hypothetical protein
MSQSQTPLAAWLTQPSETRGLSLTWNLVTGRRRRLSSSHLGGLSSAWSLAAGQRRVALSRLAYSPSAALDLQSLLTNPWRVFVDSPAASHQPNVNAVRVSMGGRWPLRPASFRRFAGAPGWPVIRSGQLDGEVGGPTDVFPLPHRVQGQAARYDRRRSRCEASASGARALQRLPNHLS